MEQERVREDRFLAVDKIENSYYHQEHVSHPISEKVDELGSLVGIEPQQLFPNSYKPRMPRVCEQVSFLQF